MSKNCDDPLWMREDWKTDSLKWRGEVLKGKYAHWCHDWDSLPVDETTPEFQACSCWAGDAGAERARDAIVAP